MNLFAMDESKQERMDMLRQEAESNKAQLCPEREKVVWGEGSLDAPIVIVGEAPGDYEERQGRPFVGPAGKLLERELLNLGMKREDLYITNVVKCRPAAKSGNRVVNRTPTAKETKDWIAYLLDELAIVEPSVIICMGAIAANNLIHKKFAMLSERGHWFEGPLGTRIIATLHPAYILRQQGQDYDERIEQFRLDLSYARDEAAKIGAEHPRVA